MPWCSAATGLRAASGGCTRVACAGGAWAGARTAMEANIMLAKAGSHASRRLGRAESWPPTAARAWHLRGMRYGLAFGAGEHAAADAVGKGDHGRILTAAALEPS